MNLAWVADLSGLGLAVLSAAIVVPFARRFRPDKWYAHGFWVLILVLLTSYGAALAIRTFLFQPFSMPSASMEPTLQLGNYSSLPNMPMAMAATVSLSGCCRVEGRVLGSPPKRGDVVVFRPRSDPETDYVKRIVGMPGDRIQVIDERLYINRVPVEIEDFGDYVTQDIRSARLQRETLPEGISYLVIDNDVSSAGDDTPEIVVPPGEYSCWATTATIRLTAALPWARCRMAISSARRCACSGFKRVRLCRAAGRERIG
ncbi:signal peptidase I [Mesorhizobium sp. WSM4935]|uniref:signal peptidase I n=1 Tax=Mesorhizobium sp. WSM4935 TaxID=3038547 RepID=UPI0024152B8B|nr:signal peptidase I [Mesorhizobium sp. WSM4935]MDG4879401.1 signal peptidase I [Mesorhizobium sp. WSM4935]